MAGVGPTPSAEDRWFLPGVRAIGAASLLSDLGHEVPTALLPSFLAKTLGLGVARAAGALGLIEGFADGASGVARFAGGPLADDPARRRTTAVGGYTSTAIFSSLIGVTTGAWQVGVLRSLAWASRGIRGPSRNALLADIAPPAAYGRAYGFERAMDNLGAIGGPLLAIVLVALTSVRTAILVSVIPGLLAAVAIVFAIRLAPRLAPREHKPIKIQVRPVLQGRLGGLMFGITAFELGNVAATLLILRTTELIAPGHAYSRTAVLLYAGYNLAATLIAIPAGQLTDRRGAAVVLVLAAALYGGGFVGFAFAGASIPLLGLMFVLVGFGNGVGETAESAAVAAFAPAEIRGSAFGLVAAVQAFANLAASAVAGLLWRLVSPEAAFLYLAGWSILAAIAFAASMRARG